MNRVTKPGEYIPYDQENDEVLPEGHIVNFDSFAEAPHPPPEAEPSWTHHVAQVQKNVSLIHRPALLAD